MAAFGPESLFCDMPPDLGVGQNRGMTGRAPLDMVAPADRVRLLQHWEALVRDGYADFTVQLVIWCSVARFVAFNFLDEHGVCVLVAWPETTPAAAPVATARSVVASSAPLVARVRKNNMAMITDADESATAMLGWRGSDLVGRRSIDLIHPDDHSVAVDSWLQMMSHPGPARRVRLRHLCADGSWKWLEISNMNLLEDEAYGCVLTDMVDIGDEMAAWEAVRAREQLLEQLARALPVGVMQFDGAGGLVYSNERLKELVGTVPATVAEVVELAAPADRVAFGAALDGVRGGGPGRSVHATTGAAGEGEGEPRLCEVSLRPLTGPAGEATGGIACFTDVTEGVRLRRELEQRAATDDLTGCANRRAVMAALDDSLAAAGRTGAGTAAIFVDLDGFKRVNDTLGHVVGDAVLANVGRRLLGAVRSVDRVGRVGGDEFLVVCPGVASLEETSAVASRLASALAGRLNACGHEVELRASFGAAWAAGGGYSADALVRSADSAMYRSKAAAGPPVSVLAEEVPRERRAGPGGQPGEAAGHPSSTRRRRGVPALPRAGDEQSVP